MDFIVIISSCIVFSSNCVEAQIFVIPIISETIPSDDAYECRCNFVNNYYDPVCGSDGFTYPNFSQFHCDKKCKNPDLILLHKGLCKTNEPRSRSSTNHNSTQTNRNFKILNRCPCSIDSEYNPVCGSNGITYDNLSELLCDKKCKQSNLNIARFGLCREEEYFKDVLPFLTNAINKCNCMYNDEYDPICGTDGYTYPNLSAMSCVTECNNPSLQVVHYGSCNDNQKPHNYGAVRCNCVSSSEIYRPICANNGITYDNLSLFSCAQKCLNRSLKILYENPCRDYLDIDDRQLKK
ncbi:PREDICTED: serine protease inhibitor dipetalogastin-like isoform X2 [Ceratosolen solmsi marchali]|uniref:Serine protease inhibitor dipetalogastin-like isoform X2 n=1 Tax=Ceratosolen solmsi marchali TaxID=326594 RepID=A0AAJ7DV08_9HYME|nr:PREDICTED: serine protease inhibitor dipetalogastin-like isoform X2 [Ceratosolen solmsi marchali]